MLDKILDYWEKMARYALPFLKDRKVAIEVKFDDFTLYQRHPKDEPNIWLYIDSEKDIVDWADRHAWSFHPHIEGKNDWWFVMDIDGRTKSVDLETVKDVAVEMAKIFDQMNLKYLVKFSGNRGFHFMWQWDMDGTKLDENERWESAKSLVLQYRDKLEESIAANKKLAEKLQKLVNKNCDFTITNSQDPKCQNSILLDVNILHVNANIRSPFSVHLKTGLVSVPLNGVEGLKNFKIEDAERDRVVKQKWGWVKMPVNRWKIM